jgi:hypothetical protein
VRLPPSSKRFPSPLSLALGFRAAPLATHRSGIRPEQLLATRTALPPVHPDLVGPPAARCDPSPAANLARLRRHRTSRAGRANARRWLWSTAGSAGAAASTTSRVLHDLLLVGPLLKAIQHRLGPVRNAQNAPTPNDAR